MLVVSIDGLRRDYLDGLDDHRTPNLARLVHEGAVAQSLISVWPSVTYPAHVTMVTGVAPARHGIINNVVFDPYEQNAGGWSWYAPDVRVPAVWDVARAHGIDRIANVTWPVTIGAPAITWNLPQFWRAKTPEDDKLLCALSTRGLCDELAGDHLAIPAEHRGDRERCMVAAHLFREERPRLTFLYLPDLDTAQHASGPQSPLAWSKLEALDESLGVVLSAASTHKRLTVMIVSDHGFAGVRREVRPNVILRQEGLLDTTGQGAWTRVTGYRAITWKAGGVAAIMSGPPHDASTKRDRALEDTLYERFANLGVEGGIKRVWRGEEVESLGGFPSALLVLEAASGYAFSERVDEPLTVPAGYRGMHGYDPASPEMAASFVLWGDGVRPHAKLGHVRMVDVAPTIAALLGFDMPTAEGHAVRDALF